MASSSSSSFRVRQMKYDVFISFRGSDTRCGFLSHLTRELRQNQIDAYVDERLERGDEISSALLKAIEESHISIIIFSESYAYSKWCLEELVKIIECMEGNKRFVIPVFYHIDPSNVRHQKGTYGDAFAEHEVKFKENVLKVNNWRSALKNAADLSGYDSSNFGSESELIDEIVKDILKKLSSIYPVEPKGLVGIDRNFACIESLMVIDPEEVRVLGIWGMGGIGKTTIAEAVFDKFSFQYESCCFLENVREETEKNGLSYLFKKLLSELLEEENLLKHGTTRTKSYLIKRRLSRKKALIVLDDVSSQEQLEYLVEEPNCLGPGSRVIITSRDKHVLNDNRVDAIHAVEELNFHDSLKLFCLNAFNQNHPKMEYVELSKRAVVYAQGIPLALKVLGSHFHSRNIETWESALKKLHKHPNVQVQNVLKVSYYGLDDIEKEIFLDIAFFLKGKCKNDVIRVLDACNFYAACGIDSLVDKTLITISNDNIEQMHDLIQEMGYQIVRQESIKDPGRRSRLKDVEEVYDVLKNNKGTYAIEGIMLDVSQVKYVQLSAETFTKMTNLRILKFYYSLYKRSCNVHLPSGLESLSNSLRYLHWDGYPLKSLPLSFCPEKLVELHMEGSCVKRLWEGVQDFVNLKRINLKRSKKLIDLPDFSKAQNLELVDLSQCTSLCSVHPSILSLHSLATLNLYFCKKLKSLKSENQLKSLRDLDVSYCMRLKEFSLWAEEITDLYFNDTGIEILHSSIGHLSKLRSLSVSGSTLKTLPINELCCLKSLQELCLCDCGQLIDKPKLQILFDGLPSLQQLYLNRCSNFSDLPDNISALPRLRELGLDGTSVESLPASIKHLSNLKKILLSDCKSLRTLPELPPFIAHLNANNCTSLETVTLTTSILQQNKEGEYFLFINCLKLDEHSLIMELAQFSMKRAVYNNFGAVKVCYPGNKVPEWFKYKQMTEASITIELVPTVDDLLGFIFCSVLSQNVSKERSYLKCQCYLEDGEKVRKTSGWGYSMTDPELNMDHIFLWYDPFYCKKILEGFERRRGIDEGTTYNPKVSFQFYLVTDYSKTDEIKYDELIRECGVYPIYASEYHNFGQQMELALELGTQTKRNRDIDEEQQLPPIQK